MLGCRTAPATRCFGLAIALATAAPAPAPAQQALTAAGTEFVLTTPDGRTLHGADLVGATLNIAAAGKQVEIMIKSVEEDPHAVGGRVFLHQFVVKDEAGMQVDMCNPDTQRRSLGFPVPDGHGGFALTCTSGAVGKCIRWGYRPWEEQPGGPPLAALHQACVHMARADYGGDGRATTREGMLIYWCDRFGLRPCGEDAPVAFEAAWGRDGAICVAHPRIRENVSLEQLAERYPWLKSHLGPAACSEDSAAQDPAALLFNRS
jgi:ADYC domain-containing protein